MVDPFRHFEMSGPISRVCSTWASLFYRGHFPWCFIHSLAKNSTSFTKPKAANANQMNHRFWNEFRAQGTTQERSMGKNNCATLPRFYTVVLDALFFFTGILIPSNVPHISYVSLCFILTVNPSIKHSYRAFFHFCADETLNVIF